MKRAVLCAMLVAAASDGVAGPASDKAMAAADLVVTGRVIAIGFGSDMFDPGVRTEFAAVLVESVQKGVPATPVKLLIDDSLQDIACCASGGHFKMYLKHRPDGFYGAVGGHKGIVRTD